MTMRRMVDLEEMLARTGDGACAVAPDARIVLWNRAAERILGHPAREVVGRRCCDVFHAADEAGNRLCDRDCHVLRLARAGDEIRSFDLCTQSKAGRTVWLNMSVLEARNGDDRGALVVHLFRDVTASHEVLRRIGDGLGRPAAGPAPDPGAALPSPLSRRELEILRLVATGVRTRALAERLSVSPATVRNHVQNIFGKLGVHSRIEAVARANRLGLLPAVAAEAPAPMPGGAR